MKTSGIIYHSEWESDSESVSLREEVVVTSFETDDVDFSSEKFSQAVDPVAQNRDLGESYFSESREPIESGVVKIQETRQEVVSESKRDGWLGRSGLSDRGIYRPGAKIALPKRKRLKFLRKFFGLLLFFPKKLIRKIMDRKVIGFPLRAIDRLLNKLLRVLKKLSRALKMGKVFRSFHRVVSAVSRIVLKSLKKLLRALRMFKLRGIVHYPIRITTGTFKSILKILKQPLKVFRVFKIVNKDRTSKVLKTSSKYSGKSAKVLLKGTKWLTIKTVKLIPPTASLTYRGAKKIKSNDILFRLVIAAIAGIIFFSMIFVGYGQL